MEGGKKEGGKERKGGSEEGWKEKKKREMGGRESREQVLAPQISQNQGGAGRSCLPDFSASLHNSKQSQISGPNAPRWSAGNLGGSARNSDAPAGQQ